MKDTLLVIGIVLAIPAMLLAGYALIGFMDWIFSDPFDWVDNPAYTPYEERPGYKECVENGGVPISDKWNGGLGRCDYPPTS